MAEYTVMHKESGKEVTFEWNAKELPTEKDMEDVFSAADRFKNPIDDSLDIPGEPDVGDLSRVETQVMSKAARPALEMGGMVGGGIVGFGSGGPVGGVVGGGLGYAGGKGLADRLDEFLGLAEPMSFWEASGETAKDFTHGMAFEAGGQGAGKILEHTGRSVWKLAEEKGVIDFFRKIKSYYPKLSDGAIMKKAKDLLSSIREDVSGVGEKTAKETDELLKRMDVKTSPTHSQTTGSPKSAAFEQGASAKDGELLTILKRNDAEIGEQGVAHVQKQFSGTGTAQDVVEGVGGVQAELEQSVAQATEKVRSQVGKIRAGKNAQEAGLDIHTVLKEGKTASKEFVDDLYAKIPKGVELGGDELITTIRKVFADFKKIGGGTTTYPKEIINQIKVALKENMKAGKGKVVTFENLQDWSKQIGRQVRVHGSGAQPNLEMVRRLRMLKEGIDDSMDMMLKHGDAKVVGAYKTAKDAFVKHFNKFRAGTVGDVLQPGTLSTGNKVAFSDIPNRFFSQGKMDVADDLVRAVGKEDAAKLVDDFAGHDLLSKTRGDLSTGGEQWLRKNKTVLDKYGLYDKYKKIVQSKSGLDATVETLNTFNKSVASKVLNSDVDKIIAKVFGGAGKTNSAKAASNLLNTKGIKGNKTAIDGIKNSFKDFLLKRMENSGVDILGNPIMSLPKAKTVIQEYLPAMRVLYKDSPQKIKAFQDYHKLLEMLARSKNISYAGGSTTTEKMFGGEISSIISNSAQLAAVHLKKGWFFSASKNLFKSILGSPGKFTRKQVESVLREAIYNPEMASTIMKATKPIPKFRIEKEINHHLLTMGIYSGYQLAKD